MDQFAATVSQACTLLESVDFARLYEPKLYSSEAETYAMHFPNCKSLKFFSDPCSGQRHYEPVNYDRIAASAERCRATECVLSTCLVSEGLVATLLRSPMPSRLQKLDLDYADISTKNILKIATACPGLRELSVFTSSHMSDVFVQRRAPAFFESLWRARPELTRLNVDLRWQHRHTNDLCLRSISKFSLKKLWLVEDVEVKFSAAGVDAILSGPLSQTIKELNGVDSSLPSSELLRLAQGCPKLKYLNVDAAEDPRDGDKKTWKRVKKILKRRGGSLETFCFSSDGYDTDGDPNGYYPNTTGEGDY